jgi:hypothetical protein
MGKKKLRPATFALETPAALASDGPPEVPATGLIRSTGVGLKESEVRLLDQIAEDVGLARNSVMRFGLRYFLKQYLAGQVDLAGHIKTETARKMDWS